MSILNKLTTPFVKLAVGFLKLDYDSLTGLPNHSHLVRRLGQYVGMIECGLLDDVAVIYVDMDDFKVLNDTLGHEAGNQVLRQFSARVKELLGPQEFAARTGGDEFVIVLTNVGCRMEAVVRAFEFFNRLRSGYTAAGQSLDLRLSVGVEWSDLDSAALAEVSDQQTSNHHMVLVDRADRAMYIAKQGLGPGKLQVVAYNDAVWQETVQERDYRARLRQALDSRQFDICYQPIVDLDTGQWVAAEALVKPRGTWPTEKSLSHDITLLEAQGAITSLWEEVMESACALLGRVLPKRPDFRISVNLSPAQLATDDIVTKAQEVTSRHGVSPRSLIFELTESLEIESHLQFHLETLRVLGFELAIDDFGAKNSNLIRLINFGQFEGVKIDQGVTGKLLHNQAARAVMRHVLAMVEELGKYTVAEGVEHQAELDFLRQAGCRFAQGYLLAEPLSAEALAGEIASRKITA